MGAARYAEGRSGALRTVPLLYLESAVTPHKKEKQFPADAAIHQESDEVILLKFLYSCAKLRTRGSVGKNEKS